MLAPNLIIVRGERSLPANSRRAAIHRLEIPYGRFERRIALPAGAFELMDRQLEHGCLALTLRRLTLNENTMQLEKSQPQGPDETAPPPRRMRRRAAARSRCPTTR